MSAKIIPFRIVVNPVLHSDLMMPLQHNADMDYDTVASKALVALTREKNWTDCFHPNGKLNGRALAEKLTSEAKQRGSKKTVHQSMIHRLQKGELTGKPKTIEPIAIGFGITVVDLYARMQPDSAAPPALALPAAAGELWSDFDRMPRAMQAYYREQIRATREHAERFPHIAALGSSEAIRAAEEVRTQRVRSKRQREEGSK